jgi:glycogen operon protein
LDQPFPLRRYGSLEQDLAMKIRPGQPYPLGATPDAEGVNFALFSENATKVELCLFDSPDARSESARIPLLERTNQVWHAHLPGLKPGTIYGYRVHGPYDPAAGHRFNPNKVVLDPYAKVLARGVIWDDSLFGYTIGSEQQDLSFDQRDSAAFAPLARVVDSTFDWGDDRPPRTPWSRTVIYELHVKGYTKLHPHLPEAVRGTYLGLADDRILDELKQLGITAVELLPVHHHVDDQFLVQRGLVNYWGYNTLAFFAPDFRYSTDPGSAAPVAEFKTMVRALHSAGIEVILDVVYNHTAEGNQLGPTLCLRGIDNAAYYHLAPDPRYYMDFTGCGNTPRMSHPRTLQLIMDSLRYWVTEMHVDGFRFDLAATLARELYEVDRLGAFFDIIAQDPILSQVKLIAEPWDVGPGGYQVGNFPVGWAEWNGIYRDQVRSFWKGDGNTVSELATRLSGSPDLYAEDGRHPSASINFITCHDGFTLHDLVSYNEKHNEANGEDNRDGANDNLSWNCGVEGPTDDPEILALRDRQMRNLLATLLLSQGVPMLLAGDERAHSQQGNNNGYCQDNELTWLSWNLTPEQTRLRDFVRSLIRLRAEEPVFRRHRFFRGRPLRGSDVKDIYWLRSDGQEMSDEDWNAGHRCIGVGLVGTELPEIDEHGDPIQGRSFLILLNAHHEPVEFQLGGRHLFDRYRRIFDTARPDAPDDVIPADSSYPLRERSAVLLQAELNSQA